MPILSKFSTDSLCFVRNLNAMALWEILEVHCKFGQWYQISCRLHLEIGNVLLSIAWRLLCSFPTPTLLWMSSHSTIKQNKAAGNIVIMFSLLLKLGTKIRFQHELRYPSFLIEYVYVWVLRQWARAKIFYLVLS